MSANTDPAGFDPEATGAFRVDTLSNSGAALKADTPRILPPQPMATAPSGPALVYVHSRNGTQTLIDLHAPGATIENADDKLRELMLARALLRHALHLVDKELNGL